MWWILACTLAISSEARAGRAYLGADLVPLGRSDLFAAAEDAPLGSGTGFGEFDGLLRPPLSAWGGWSVGQRAVLQLSLAAGWERTATYVGQSRTVSARGGLRPALDQRLYLGGAPFTAQRRVQPWAQWGVYGVVPWAREASTAWTEEEAEAQAAQASADRGRIGGYGVRAGGGVEIRVADGASGSAGSGLYLGVRHVWVAHQGRVRSEDGVSISTQIRPETALTVGWRL